MATSETDREGNLLLKPMAGWELKSVAGMALILGIEYAENQEALEMGETQTIPLVLLPALALELAEALKRRASALLAEETPKGTSLQ